MRLSNRAKIVSAATLYRMKTENVTVYIPDIPWPIADLLTGRDTVGWERRAQYKRALTAALAFCWGHIATEEKLPGTIPIASLLRGGEYIRPEDLSTVMRQHIPHVGLRVERYQDEAGVWRAEVDRTASFHLDALVGERVCGDIDECAASGVSKVKAALSILDVSKKMERMVSICPIFSDVALRRLTELPFPVILITFGVFKVMEHGWKKPFTDIVATPPRGEGSEDPYIMIPDSIWDLCWKVYGSLLGHRGMCLAGDASRNLSDNRRDQVIDLIEGGQEWVHWNSTLPTHKLWVGLHDRVCGVPFHSSRQAIAWQKEMERIAAEGVAGITDRAVCGRHFDDLEGLWRQIMAQNGK